MIIFTCLQGLSKLEIPSIVRTNNGNRKLLRKTSWSPKASSIVEFLSGRYVNMNVETTWSTSKQKHILANQRTITSRVITYFHIHPGRNNDRSSAPDSLTTLNPGICLSTHPPTLHWSMITVLTTCKNKLWTHYLKNTATHLLYAKTSCSCHHLRRAPDTVSRNQ